jgi:hypothetical protein
MKEIIAACPKAAPPPPLYIALKSSSERLPLPADGIVTARLASGATIRLRARDIDYERTGAYKNRIIIKAETSTSMVEKDSGRRYLNLTFSNRFVATAWEDDVETKIDDKLFS